MADGERGERGPQGDHGQPGERGETGKTEPVTIWFGINRWTWAGIAFAVVVALGGYATWRIDQRFESQVQTFARYSLAQDYKSCVNQNKNAEKIRDLIILATDPSTRLDTTAVPGFDKIPKATQDYLRNVKTQTDARNASAAGFRARALEGFTLRDCQAEYPDVDPATVDAATTTLTRR